MRAGDRRRLESVERSIASSSVYAPETLADAQLIDALTNRTATPADMKQVYDICAPDLEIRLFQEGATATRRILTTGGIGRASNHSTRRPSFSATAPTRSSASSSGGSHRSNLPCGSSPMGDAAPVVGRASPSSLRSGRTRHW